MHPGRYGKQLYDLYEGFAEYLPESHILPTHYFVSGRASENKILIKNRTKLLEPKLRLVYLGKEQTGRDKIRQSLHSKETNHANICSLDLSRRHKTNTIDYYLNNCVAKMNRKVVGENIYCPDFSAKISAAVKQYILDTGGNLVYEMIRETNTHGFLRELMKNSYGFSMNNLNKLLKQKLKYSVIIGQSPAPGKVYDLHFNTDFYSANLYFASRNLLGEYDLYMNNDSNTHGHQSWFNFRVTNLKSYTIKIVFNICNFKRYLKFFEYGARIYMRKCVNGEPKGYLKQTGDKFVMKSQQNVKNNTNQVYRLSFEMELEAKQYYYLSLLPPYTYSNLLTDIDSIQHRPHVHIQTLNYSLLGLAIPILTFTMPNYIHDKQVILVSCRIHPGYTVASFVGRGLMLQLSSDDPRICKFLEKHIVKVVPMLNPDGVIVGNFRTSNYYFYIDFLGNDLNRSFNSDDDLINPYVVALKTLGNKLKEYFGSRFILFLDLHGHSSYKNIFLYGPNSESSYHLAQIRLLPKILSCKSPYFKYSSCSFRLYDYKRNTARGYFIQTLMVPSYTVEVSYSFYVDQQGKNVQLHVTDWMIFGNQLADGLALWAKLIKLTSPSRLDINGDINKADRYQLEMIKRFRKYFKKYYKYQTIVKLPKEKYDSDAEDDLEDLNRNEKEYVYKRVHSSLARYIAFPKIFKHTVLYPTIIPRISKARVYLSIIPLKIYYNKKPSDKSFHLHDNYIHSLRNIDTKKSPLYHHKRER